MTKGRIACTAVEGTQLDGLIELHMPSSKSVRVDPVQSFNVEKAVHSGQKFIVTELF